MQRQKKIKMEVYLLEWDEYAVWITIQTIHCTQFKYAGYSNSFQGPKLKTEYRVETKFRKSGSMNGVRQVLFNDTLLNFWL